MKVFREKAVGVSLLRKLVNQSWSYVPSFYEATSGSPVTEVRYKACWPVSECRFYLNLGGTAD